MDFFFFKNILKFPESLSEFFKIQNIGPKPLQTWNETDKILCVVWETLGMTQNLLGGSRLFPKVVNRTEP